MPDFRVCRMRGKPPWCSSAAWTRRVRSIPNIEARSPTATRATRFGRRYSRGFRRTEQGWTDPSADAGDRARFCNVETTEACTLKQRCAGNPGSRPHRHGAPLWPAQFRANPRERSAGAGWFGEAMGSALFRPPNADCPALTGKGEKAVADDVEQTRWQHAIGDRGRIAAWNGT